MKPFLKKFFRIIFIIIIAAGFALLGFYFNKFGWDMLRPTSLVEQVPFGEVLEVLEFKEAEFYDSTNEFIGAELRIKVKYASHIEPAEKLPSEYKRGLKKAYSNVVVYVKEIPSEEVLQKMIEALKESSYLKLIENKDVQVSFVETRINNKKVKSIEKIFVKPESYYFIKY